MRDDKVYLQHIGESIDLIEPYLAGAVGTGVIVADLPTLKAAIHKELGRASSS